MAERRRDSGHELHLSASIGVAVYPVDDQDADTLLRNADLAMYHAKRRAQQLPVLLARMSDAPERHAELQRSCARALERHEFELHYQPR